MWTQAVAIHEGMETGVFWRPSGRPRLVDRNRPLSGVRLLQALQKRAGRARGLR